MPRVRNVQIKIFHVINPLVGRENIRYSFFISSVSNTISEALLSLLKVIEWYYSHVVPAQNKRSQKKIFWENIGSKQHWTSLTSIVWPEKTLRCLYFLLCFTEDRRSYRHETIIAYNNERMCSFEPGTWHTWYFMVFPMWIIRKHCGFSWLHCFLHQTRFLLTSLNPDESPDPEDYSAQPSDSVNPSDSLTSCGFHSCRRTCSGSRPVPSTRIRAGKKESPALSVMRIEA